MKNKIYNIVLMILAIALIAVIALIAIKYGGNQIKEKELQSVVAEVKTQIQQQEPTVNENNEEQKQVKVEYKGYNVVGILKIPEIKIEYPIIDKTSSEAMKVSVTRFWGNNVNDLGNLTIAGHHYLDGTMFCNLNKLEKGSIIELTDLTGKMLQYKVFDKYIIDPNDVSCVESVETGTREVTLITCINGRNNRLVVKAREII